MNKEIAEKWVAALRSGKYKQGEDYLCQNVNGKNEYCCLGVLCDIVKAPYRDSSGIRLYHNKEGGSLPSEVMKQTGMKSSLGCLPDTTLSNLNDSGNSFETIADIIEKNWEIL